MFKGADIYHAGISQDEKGILHIYTCQLHATM